MTLLVDYILPFLVMLGVLIFFHELGHFSFCKFFGVGVERFNLGFGRRLVWRKWGETEYGISVIPFGGYVKMVGEHPEEAGDLTPAELERSFMHKAPWKRALIVFFGPFANWLLAVLIIGAIYMVGYPKPAPVVGRVFVDSAAQAAGIRPGDEIKSIDGRSIRLWDDVVAAVRDSEGRPLQFQIERAGTAATVEVTPRLTEGLDRFANQTEIWSIGIDNFPLAAQIGVLGPQTPAAAAGLKTGDTIEQVEGRAVATWDELEQLIAAAPGRALELKVSRPTYARGKGDELSVTYQELTVSATPEPLPLPNGEIGSLGVAQIGLFLFDVDEQMPAGKAGLRKGDMVVSVDDTPLSYREQFNDYVQARAGQPIEIGLVRDGLPLSVAVIPDEVQDQDILGQITSIGRIGAMFYGANALPKLSMDRTRNPLRALWWGIEDTGRITAEMGRFLAALFSGRANVHGLGGPILIAKVAGDSARQGPFTFVMMLAFISINLALVNLLPLPVLDGGVLVLIGLEKLRGKPLPLRYLEWISSIGFGMIMLLMALIIFLDISRYSLGIRNFFTNLF